MSIKLRFYLFLLQFSLRWGLNKFFNLFLKLLRSLTCSFKFWHCFFFRRWLDAFYCDNQSSCAFSELYNVTMLKRMPLFWLQKLLIYLCSVGASQIVNMQNAVVIVLKDCMLSAQSWMLHQDKVPWFFRVLRLHAANHIPSEVIQLYSLYLDPALDYIESTNN